MRTALRFVGVVNAAVWFGAAVFLTVAAGPAFFSGEMLSFLPRPHAGRAAEVILERYFLLWQWCGAIALLHLLVEYLYSGRRIQRLLLGLLPALFVLALLGGYWLVPRMHELQRERYSRLATAAQQAAAAHSFNLLHGLAEAVNLLMIIVLIYYLWSLTRLNSGPRFTALDKLKG